jgi:hypothetical protein
MDLNKLNRINIDMKDGGEWIGVKVIKGVTKADIAMLAFEHDGSMVVVNWSDVGEAHFYEGED